MKSKRKYAILCGLLFACLMGFIACDNKEEESISVQNIKYSKCASLADDAFSKGLDKPDSVVVSCSEGMVYVKHYNLMVNCGYQVVNVLVSTNEDTIRVTEYGMPDNANCLCEINNSFQIANIPSGRHVLIMEHCYPEPIQKIINL